MSKVSTIDLDILISIAERAAAKDMTPAERRSSEHIMIAFKCIRNLIEKHGSDASHPTKH